MKAAKISTDVPANDPPTRQLSVNSAVGLAEFPARLLLLWRLAIGVQLLQALVDAGA
ncbi:MAG TPA: hypothetical protein VI260_10860 [Blastocatellia bacterium]